MRNKRTATGGEGTPPARPTKSLRTMMAERPKDFDFSDIAPKVPTDAEKDEALMTLETAIGGYSPVKGHTGFYLKAMKLEQQIAMIRFEEELGAAKNQIQQIESMTRLAEKLLYRMENGEFRPATAQEIHQGFSAEELTRAFAVYGGLTKEGEASGK